MAGLARRGDFARVFIARFLKYARKRVGERLLRPERGRVFISPFSISECVYWAEGNVKVDLVEIFFRKFHLDVRGVYRDETSVGDLVDGFFEENKSLVAEMYVLAGKGNRKDA